MKMRAVKTVHHPEWVGNFNRYKRHILAFLLSAVLITSIIYMGSFPPTAQSMPGGSSNSFTMYIGNATLTNVTMSGPHQFNYTYNSLNMTLNVTRVTADVVNISNMLLIKEKEGSRLELEAPSALTTKLVAYTTNLRLTIILGEYLFELTLYGNSTIDYWQPLALLTNSYMEVVYMHAENFSTPWFSLTVT